MENFSCSECKVVASSLSNSCPSCGSRFYSINDRQRFVGIATLLCVAIVAGIFSIVQSVPVIAS